MYPMPLAPGVPVQIPVDEPVLHGPAAWRHVRRRVRGRRLAVIDTHFPWRLSGFRYQEALEFHRQFEHTSFFSLRQMTDPFPAPVHPLAEFPRVADRLGITDAYFVFLTAAVGLLGLSDAEGGSEVKVHHGGYSVARTLERLGIRTHTMLWPGGGMTANTPSSIIAAVGRRVDTVFTNVREVEDAVPTAIHVPMAVDTDFYAPVERSFDATPLRLVFAGADAGRKGLHTLLAAFATLPPGRFHLTVIGPHERHSEALDRPDITTLGWCTPEELREQYAAAHVMVSPATVERQNQGELGLVDGFPATTGSDAMATGCALVASNPRREHRGIQPGVHYVDVPVDDAGALARELVRLESDRAALAAIAAAGGARVAEFSIRRTVERKLTAMGLRSSR